MSDTNLHGIELTHALLQSALDAPPKPLLYPFVRGYLSARPFQWIYAQEIVNASDGHFTLRGVGAAMGSLHDEGHVTTIGIAGQENRRAKWDHE